MTIAAHPLPTAISDLTAAWLTQALRHSEAIAAEASVVSFRTQRIAEGVGFASHLYRVFLEIDATGPETLIMKLPSNNAAYLELALAIRLYDREVSFYSDVAPLAPVRSPKAHVAQIVSGTTDFVILMEDLAHLENGDHVAGVSLSRTEVIIDELVRFHAWGWDCTPPAASNSAFLAVDDPRMAGLFITGITNGWPIHVANSDLVAPEVLVNVIERCTETLPAILHALTTPTTLVNGDIRVDNVFFDRDDVPTVVDYQLTGRGCGIWDIAYLVGQGMNPTERNGHERELVRRYTDGLAASGIDYEFEQAWDQFRLALLAQIALPLLAMMSWETLNERGKDLLRALMERSFSVIDDTDAASVVHGLLAR